MIDFICFIISMVDTMFFFQQKNYIFFVIENAIMLYYASSAFEWFFNTLNIRGSNADKFDKQYEQRLLDKQERENWHPRKDRVYLSSLDLKDVEWTRTEKKSL